MPLADDAWLLSPPAPPKLSNPSSEERLFKEGPNLTDKEEVQCCQGCKIKFSLVLRKHNCKVCGRVFCGKCSCVVHLVKLNEKKSTRRTEETIQRSRKTDNSLNSLSVKLLGVRVCSACQDIDSASANLFSRKKSKPLNNNTNNIAKNYSSLSTKSPANNELDNKENMGCDLQLLRVLQNSRDNLNREIVLSTDDHRLSPISATTHHHSSHPSSSSSTSSLSCPLHIEILQLQSSQHKVEESGSESSSSTISTSSCTQLLQDSISEELRQASAEAENISDSGFGKSEGKLDDENAIASVVMGTSPGGGSHPLGRKEGASVNHRSSQSSKVKGRIWATTENSSSWYLILWSCFATIGCGCVSPPSAATNRTACQ